MKILIGAYLFLCLIDMQASGKKSNSFKRTAAGKIFVKNQPKKKIESSPNTPSYKELQEFEKLQKKHAETLKKNKSLNELNDYIERQRQSVKSIRDDSSINIYTRSDSRRATRLEKEIKELERFKELSTKLQRDSIKLTVGEKRQKQEKAEMPQGTGEKFIQSTTGQTTKLPEQLTVQQVEDLRTFIAQGKAKYQLDSATINHIDQAISNKNSAIVQEVDGTKILGLRNEITELNNLRTAVLRIEEYARNRPTESRLQRTKREQGLKALYSGSNPGFTKNISLPKQANGSTSTAANKNSTLSQSTGPQAKPDLLSDSYKLPEIKRGQSFEEISPILEQLKKDTQIALTGYKKQLDTYLAEHYQPTKRQVSNRVLVQNLLAEKQNKLKEQPKDLTLQREVQDLTKISAAQQIYYNKTGLNF